MSITTVSWRSHTNGGYRFRIEAERLAHTAADQTENRTRIRFRAFWESMGAGWDLRFSGNRTVTINLPSGIAGGNITATMSNADLNGNQSREVIQWVERTFPHNADGTRPNFTFSGTITPSMTFTGGNLAGQTFNIATGSSPSISFVTIPRQSTINADPNFTAFSGRLSVAMTRHSTNHSNDIRIAVRDTTATNTTDAFGHSSFRQLIGWTHFTGNTFNFNMTTAQLTTLFTAMRGATTRQIIVETRTRNGTANNATIIGAIQTRRGTVTAPNANTATLSHVTFDANATSGNIAFTISRASAGTSQEGSLQTYLRLRHGTTNITDWTGRLNTTTGNIALSSANLSTIRAAISNGRSITTINAEVWTTYNGVQVRGTGSTGNVTITFNLASLLTTTVASVPSGSNGSLGSTTFIQGRSNAIISFPANFAPVSNGWANSTFQARRGATNVGSAINAQTTAGTMTVTGLNTPGSEEVSIRVTDTNANTRDSRQSINVVAYSAPTFNPVAVRHATLANTVVISGTGWRQAITGTGVGALTNQLELRTRHRTRTIGSNHWSGWTSWVTRIAATNTTVNLAATNITVPDDNEVEIEFQHRDNVVHRYDDINRSWIRSTAMAPVVMPTLFIGSGNGRVGVGTIPRENNSFEIGEGIKFEMGGSMSRAANTGGSNWVANQTNMVGGDTRALIRQRIRHNSSEWHPIVSAGLANANNGYAGTWSLGVLRSGDASSFRLQWYNAARNANGVDGSITFNNNGTISAGIVGNATTATTLQTARTINGTSFNGAANITTANWGTARDITIGNTTRSVNGSGNLTWTLANIGAAATTHTHHANSLTSATPASANNSGRAIIGNLCIQWGQLTTASLGVGASTTNTINFTSAFAHTPNVQAVAHSTNFTCAIGAVNTASTTINTRHTVSVNAGTATVRWVAIGRIA